MAHAEDTYKAAESYDKRGWRLVALKNAGKNGKQPRRRGWRSMENAEVLEVLEEHPEANLGIALGEASGHLVDIDLDSQLAIDLAPAFLPETPLTFGRASKPRSHWLYLCQQPKTKQFESKARGDEKGEMLVEIRSNGGQTAFPPTIHNTDEVVEWDEGVDPKADPTTVAPQVLREAASRLAGAVLLANNWSGSRHNQALGVAGMLGQAGWSREDATNFIEAVARAAGDDEVDDRLTAVNTTFDAIEAKQPVMADKGLVENEYLSSSVVDTLKKWLAIQHSFSTGIRGSLVYYDPSRIVETMTLMSDVVKTSDAAVYEKHGLGAVEITHGLPTRRTTTSGAVVVEPFAVRALEPATLRVHLSREHRWMKPLADGGAKPSPPPEREMESWLAATPRDRDLKPLNGIVAAPTIRWCSEIGRPDGYSILSEPGYDIETGIYLDWNEPFEMPDWTKDKELDRCAKLFRELLSEVAFENSDTGMSQWLSGLLSVLLRPLIGLAPMHLYDAPMPGSGKSFLVEMLSSIALGTVAPPISQGRGEDEFEKRLDSAILNGAPLLYIDNIERQLRGSKLAVLLSNEAVKVRVLGKSKEVTTRPQSTVFATGNNCSIYRDLVRRTLAVRLDTNDSRPDRRKFSLSPLEMIRSRRGEYVGAALALAMAYVDDGCPDVTEYMCAPPLAGFEGWDRYVRRALIYCNFEDPLLAQQHSEVVNADQDELSGLLIALRGVFGDKEFTAGDLWDRTRASSVVAIKDAEAIEALKGHFSTARSTRALGMMLRHQIGKPSGDLRLLCERGKAGNEYRIKIA